MTVHNVCPQPCRGRKNLCCLSFAMSLSFSGLSLASENGQVHYPIGVNTIMNGALPAPDETALYIYTQYYNSKRLNDGDGNSIDKYFRANVYAVAPRIVHTWKQKVGPFHLASGIIQPISRVEVNAFGRKDVSTGLGDTVLQPVYLTYVNPTGTFFAYAGPEIYAPAGRYDKNRLANNGLHYWAIAPIASFTWLPSPRWEFSGTIYSEFNFKNKATNYRSGNSATVDFDIAYRPSTSLPHLKVALQGFALKQFTDDRRNGVPVPGGNRGQAFGLGPQVSYDIKGTGALLLKYQREFGVENRTQGNRIWFEAAIPF